MIIVWGVGGGAAHATDLLEIHDLARAADPQLQAAAEDFQAVRENETQARAAFFPNADFQYSVERQSFVQSARNQSLEQTITNKSKTFQVVQPIYRHSNFAGLDRAQAQVAQGHADYQDALDQFLLRVAERYFAVLTAEDNLRFTEAEQKALKRQLDQARQRFEVGLTAITDVHEAKASYDDARARTIVAQNDLDDAREGLRELTGRYVEDIEPLREELPLNPPQPDSTAGWVRRALDQSPSLRSQRAAKRIASADVSDARAGHFPQVDLNLSVVRSSRGGLFGSDFDAVTGAIEVNLPVFRGGATVSQVQEAKDREEAAYQRLVQELRTVKREVRNAYRGVIASISEVEARQQAVVSARSALDATEAGFEVGTRTIVDVLIGQQNLFQAQRDLSQARHDYLLNKLRLREAAGVLSIKDLKWVNRLLK